MNRRSCSALLVALVAIGLAVAGEGCATRPVSSSAPVTETIFTAVTRSTKIDKIDLLFAIDNSASMGDKQALLGEAVPDLLGRLLAPDCVDADGKPNGARVDPATGLCPRGDAEFPPVHDLHVGVVSSSLGGRGSDACDSAETNPTPFPQHNDDRAHLLDRVGDAETPLAGSDADPSHFLVWRPGGDAAALEHDFGDLVVGVHEHGCGYEAQLESWYRFLVQPDPFDHVARPDPDHAALEGVDDELLRERHDFLRPDSLVAIVQLTDENDSTIDPMAFGQRAWRFEQQYDDQHRAAHVMSGTSVCARDPEDPSCRSCWLSSAAASGDPACAAPLDDVTDPPNLRFFHPRERFGYDPRFPTDRYVRGLTQRLVPDRFGEHTGGTSFDYVGKAECTNPLFAGRLPTSSRDGDICHLPPGRRSPDSGLVFYAIVGGVPWQLLTEDPTSFSNDNHAPFKATLSADDWTRILGADPAKHDLTGIDPHMIESTTPRPGVASDDAHTREWDTHGRDLEYACTFPLPGGAKDCNDVRFRGACDCEEQPNDSPLCDATSATKQIRGKAYPTVNELIVAKALGDQAVVASLCPREVSDTGSPDYGYRPAVRAIVDRLKTTLDDTCSPQKLARDPATGEVPCLVLVERPDLPSQAACDDPAHGISDPTKSPALVDAVARFRTEQGIGDEVLCASLQIDPARLPPDGSCDAPNAPAGWCYVEGAAAKGCSQRLVFSPAGTPGGVTHLACIERTR